LDSLRAAEQTDRRAAATIAALQLERIEQSGKELSDPREDGGQPFMERIHGTPHYG
jgi:hypothetical protein